MVEGIEKAFDIKAQGTDFSAIRITDEVKDFFGKIDVTLVAKLVELNTAIGDYAIVQHRICPVDIIKLGCDEMTVVGKDLCIEVIGVENLTCFFLFCSQLCSTPGFTLRSSEAVFTDGIVDERIKSVANNLGWIAHVSPDERNVFWDQGVRKMGIFFEFQPVFHC